MYQIIINHAGLSIGEIEAINNLFKDYMTFENTIDYNYEFASALEIEFIKDKEIEFFMVLIKYLLKNKAVAVLYCSNAVQTGAKIENQVALLYRTSMDNNFLILLISL